MTCTSINKALYRALCSILLYFTSTSSQFSLFVAAAGAQIDHKHYTGIPRALPEGFFKDADAISVAVGPEHACVLEVQSGVELGGKVYCWGTQGEYTRKSSVANKVKTMRKTTIPYHHQYNYFMF
jgi:hypothetical protein